MMGSYFISYRQKFCRIQFVHAEGAFAKNLRSNFTKLIKVPELRTCVYELTDSATNVTDDKVKVALLFSGSR